MVGSVPVAKEQASAPTGETGKLENGGEWMPSLSDNIRPNLAGNYPNIHPDSLIDPSAQVIGNVEIAKDVFIGPLTVIRADQPGPDGTVGCVKIAEEVNIQDGTIIHSLPGGSVTIGARTSIAHGAVIHGPCTIGTGCFLALRSILYSANLENDVWLGMGALVMNTDIHSFSKVPAGEAIRSLAEAMKLRVTTEEEKKYMEEVLTANSRLRSVYLELRSKAKSIKSSVEGKAVKNSS